MLYIISKFLTCFFSPPLCDACDRCGEYLRSIIQIECEIKDIFFLLQQSVPLGKIRICESKKKKYKYIKT